MAPTTVPDTVLICLWKLTQKAFNVQFLLALLFPTSKVSQEWLVLI